jgi:hypothetical protein
MYLDNITRFLLWGASRGWGSTENSTARMSELRTMVLPILPNSVLIVPTSS